MSKGPVADHAAGSSQLALIMGGAAPPTSRIYGGETILLLSPPLLQYINNTMTHHRYRPSHWQTSHVSQHLRMMTHWEMKCSLIISPKMMTSKCAQDHIGTGLLILVYFFSVFLSCKWTKKNMSSQLIHDSPDVCPRALIVHLVIEPIFCGFLPLLVAMFSIALICNILSYTPRKTMETIHEPSNTEYFVGQYHTSHISVLPNYIGGVIRMLNDCHMSTLEHYSLWGLSCNSVQLVLLLVLLCGDVEINPGPYQQGKMPIRPDFLQLIRWKDRNGTQELRLYTVLATVWKQVGESICLSIYQIDIIGQNHQDQHNCIREVMTTWIKDAQNLNKYSCTWGGLCKLLNDIGISSVSEKLKEALTADVSSFKDNLPIFSEEEYLRSEQEDKPSPSTNTKSTSNTSIWTDTKNISDTSLNGISVLHHSGLQLNRNVNDKQREVLKTKLQSESNKMMMKFTKIRGKFIKFINQPGNVDIEILKSLLQSLKNYTVIFDDLPDQPTVRKDLAKANSIAQVMRIIDSYCSFFNFSLLEIIFSSIMYDEGIVLLNEYQKEFEQYAERRVIYTPSNLGMKGVEHTNVAIKLDDSYEGCNISHLLILHEEVCDILETKLAQFPLDRLDPGCVLITFHLSLLLKYEMFPLSLEQISALQNLKCTEAKIISLSCDEFHYHLKQGVQV